MIKKIEHTGIIVTNMDRSVDFYSKMFGFVVRLRGKSATREFAFLYVEGYPETEIELIRDLDPIEKYNENGIVNHLAFTVESIDRSIEHYERLGINFLTSRPQPTLEGGRMILFNGPDQELLQLVERLKK
ncbi:VOC family protein [Sporosarcina sp. PTS2304]|nr:VOC family protein [Sporosarcina sp. PTS2304]AXI00227.1 VOC family protein [Sporosarcina sp. PTS2304]